MKLLFITLIMIFVLTSITQAREAIEDVAFIDHYNLRKVYETDEEGLRGMADEIKTSLDKAKEYGADSFILFSRSFEYIINYDFENEELGDLTYKVYPADSEHRKKRDMYVKYFHEVIDYAEELDIDIIMHSNQFDFPDKLYEIAGDKISGTAAVCPGKPLAFELLKDKIRAFFVEFPKVDGFQLTLSETQARITECDCPSCADMSIADRFVRVAEAAWEVCDELDKRLLVRTWGKYEVDEIVDRLPEEIICSTKFTLPDFHLTNYPNPVMGRNGPSQEVEFDGWGEYSGYNIFPCYYGDIFAPRIRECADSDVASLGIRLNWEHDLNYIFGRPFGNEANIYVFCKLAKNPDGDPDVYLREYIAKAFPESAREAAFNLYKKSTEMQTLWLTWRGTNTNDHSRIYNGGAYRVEHQIGDVIPDDYDVVKADIDQRRKDIDAAYYEALELIDALGPDVEESWKEELRRGARECYYVAHGNCDCIEMYSAGKHADKGYPLPDLYGLADDIRLRAKRWRASDPELFDIMYGDRVVDMLDNFTRPLGER